MNGLARTFASVLRGGFPVKFGLTRRFSAVAVCERAAATSKRPPQAIISLARMFVSPRTRERIAVRPLAHAGKLGRTSKLRLKEAQYREASCNLANRNEGVNPPTLPHNFIGGPRRPENRSDWLSNFSTIAQNDTRIPFPLAKRLGRAVCGLDVGVRRPPATELLLGDRLPAHGRFLRRRQTQETTR